MGKVVHHFERLRENLIGLGYRVYAKSHMLDQFGLPQRRERALVIGVRDDYTLRTLEDLWEGYRVREEVTHVRRAIQAMPPVQTGSPHPEDILHIAPSFSDPKSLRRLQLIPRDGGSWADLRFHAEADVVLTPAMKRYIAKGDFGSHPDVYGRLAWDKPAVTIKRECAHIGNGRYAHPQQDRLCTVREMSLLQGFPKDYRFVAPGLANMYRHIGDAVPPVISYQLARLCEWILSGQKPRIGSVILPNTHLTPEDIEWVPDKKPTRLEVQLVIPINV